ncbi:MAG: hypothetical protein GYA24_24350 [Candidatus Lokiarchaeota archaeon]|nr:hypothetical protein [Candidatus Lokiarchaeota archaeon]
MPNMRLVLIQGFVGGIALAILVFAILLQFVPVIQSAAFISYIVSVCCLVALVLLSIISTFTQKTFIHPDDRLWGNTFCFILFMADTLALGHFFDPLVYGSLVSDQVRLFSYNAGSSVLITFLLIYLVLFFSKKIGFHELIMGDPNKREKEIVARFILFSILLGAVLVGLKWLLDQLYLAVHYSLGVWIIMGISFGIIVLIAVTNWKKYAPVADTIAEKKP